MKLSNKLIYFIIILYNCHQNKKSDVMYVFYENLFAGDIMEYVLLNLHIYYILKTFFFFNFIIAWSPNGLPSIITYTSDINF